MSYSYGEYTSSQLPSELVDVPSGEVRYYQGVPYKVTNTGTGGRILSAPDYSETGVQPADRFKNPEYVRQQYTEAVKPAIASYVASKPEISEKYATERSRIQGEVEPLKERYANLIEQIKGTYQSQIDKTTLATSKELGRRGVLGSSGLAEQSLTQATEPLSRELALQIKDVGFAQEADLRDIENAIRALTPQETAELRNVTNAIAQLQAQAATAGLGQAISGQQYYSTQAQQQKQFEAGQELQRYIADLSAKQNKLSLDDIFSSAFG